MPGNPVSGGCVGVRPAKYEIRQQRHSGNLRREHRLRTTGSATKSQLGFHSILACNSLLSSFVFIDIPGISPINAESMLSALFS
jgi:hypothetical protein